MMGLQATTGRKQPLRHRLRHAQLPAISVRIGRTGTVALPPGLCPFGLGARVFWRRCGESIIVEIRPRNFAPPRYLTSRVRRAVFVKRPPRRR